MEHFNIDDLFEDQCNDFENRLRNLAGALFDFKNFTGMLEQAREGALSWLVTKSEQYGGQMELVSYGVESIEDLIIDVCFTAKIEGKFQRYLFLSLVCKSWGQVSYKIGKKDEGLKFLAEANYYYGLWKGAIEFDEWNTCKDVKQDEIKDNANKGGQARSRRFDVVKKEVMRLLKEKVPEDGWKNKITAVDDITADLWLFIQSENRKIKNENALLPSYNQIRQPFIMEENNLGRTVQDWSRNDKNLKEAFSVVLRKGRK